MMDKGIHFDGFIFPVKPCLAAFILLEGMQLVDKKAALVLQDSSCFREDESQVWNVLQHKITDNEIKFLILARPGFCNISYRKSDILSPYLLFSFLDHPVRKIQCVNTVSNLGEKPCVLSCSTTYLKD